LHDFFALSQEVEHFDEIISEKDDDFISSGLKQANLIRIARLAVVEKTILLGAIGEISPARLNRINIGSLIGSSADTNSLHRMR